MVGRGLVWVGRKGCFTDDFFRVDKVSRLDASLNERYHSTPNYKFIIIIGGKIQSL